jgi:hypothetical protein
MATKAELESTVASLTTSLADAERRLDVLALLVTRLLRRTSVEAPSTVPRGEYDAALLELRGNDGESTERFVSADIVAKALDRRVDCAVQGAKAAVQRMAAKAAAAQG